MTRSGRRSASVLAPPEERRVRFAEPGRLTPRVTAEPVDEHAAPGMLERWEEREHLPSSKPEQCGTGFSTVSVRRLILLIGPVGHLPDDVGHSDPLRRRFLRCL